MRTETKFNQENFEMEIIRIIEKSVSGFLLTPQIERSIISLYPKDEFDKDLLKSKVRDTLQDLMEKGLIDALILDNVYKNWSLDRKFYINDEKPESTSIYIPEGLYFGWNFQEGISKTTINQIYKEFGVKKNEHGRFLLDTYYLRKYGTELIKGIRYYLKELIKSNDIIDSKLIWILSNKRDDFLIIPLKITNSIKIETEIRNKDSILLNNHQNNVNNLSIENEIPTQIDPNTNTPQAQSFYPLEEQTYLVKRLKIFRNLNMCEYGPILEYIEFKLFEINKLSILNKKNNMDGVNLLLSTYSDLIRSIINRHFLVDKADINRWDSFFKFFKIPIEIDGIQFENFQMKNEVFSTDIKISYSLTVDQFKDKSLELIDYLKENGYGVKSISEKGLVIGNDLSFFIYFSIEEQLNFQSHYIINFCLFQLWKQICEFYLSKGLVSGKPASILKKDIEFSGFLKKWVDILFDYDRINLPKRFNSKFINHHSKRDEIDVIYNKYLMDKYVEIETTARTFFSKRRILLKLLGEDSILKFS